MACFLFRGRYTGKNNGFGHDGLLDKTINQKRARGDVKSPLRDKVLKTDNKDSKSGTWRRKIFSTADFLLSRHEQPHEPHQIVKGLNSLRFRIRLIGAVSIEF